jgi:elongation factor 1-gamma
MADNDILPAACTWVFPTLGIMQFNKNGTDRAKEDVTQALKTLNDHLLTRSTHRNISLVLLNLPTGYHVCCRTYLVGERVTLADIAVACTLISLFKQVRQSCLGSSSCMMTHPALLES